MIPREIVDIASAGTSPEVTPGTEAWWFSRPIFTLNTYRARGTSFVPTHSDFFSRPATRECANSVARHGLANDRTTPSMKAGEYKVYAMVRVIRLHDDSSDGGVGAGDDEADGYIAAEQGRLTASDVIDAYCTCQSGFAGRCHHVCQLLQVVRLLQLSAADLQNWNPQTVTGRACAWIQVQSNAGRDPEENVFCKKTAGQIGKLLCALRDPKNKDLGAEDDEPAHTGGVVAVDRSGGYSAHPTGGMWEASREQFNKGRSWTRTQWEQLIHTYVGRHFRGDHGARRVGMDCNLPRCRDDSA